MLPASESSGLFWVRPADISGAIFPHSSYVDCILWRNRARLFKYKPLTKWAHLLVMHDPTVRRMIPLVCIRRFAIIMDWYHCHSGRFSEDLFALNSPSCMRQLGWRRMWWIRTKSGTDCIHHSSSILFTDNSEYEWLCTGENGHIRSFVSLNVSFGDASLLLNSKIMFLWRVKIDENRD